MQNEAVLDIFHMGPENSKSDSKPDNKSLSKGKYIFWIVEWYTQHAYNCRTKQTTI